MQTHSLLVTRDRCNEGKLWSLKSQFPASSIHSFLKFLPKYSNSPNNLGFLSFFCFLQSFASLDMYLSTRYPQKRYGLLKYLSLQKDLIHSTQGFLQIVEMLRERELQRFYSRQTSSSKSCTQKMVTPHLCGCVDTIWLRGKHLSTKINARSTVCKLFEDVDKPMPYCLILDHEPPL